MTSSRRIRSACLAALTAALFVPASAGAEVVSLTTPAVVKLDSAGMPQGGAITWVHRSGPDGGQTLMTVSEWGTRVVLNGPGYDRTIACTDGRCRGRAPLRGLFAVEGRKLRRHALYIVHAWYEHASGAGAPTRWVFPRYATFWTV